MMRTPRQMLTRLDPADADLSACVDMGRLTLTSRGEANRAQHQADGVRLQAAINRGGTATRAADTAALEPPPVPEPPPAAA
eukprot:1362335-Prymnesium_polylepis.1